MAVGRQKMIVMKPIQRTAMRAMGLERRPRLNGPLRTLKVLG